MATADRVTIRDTRVFSGRQDPTLRRLARSRGMVQSLCHALSSVFQ